MFTLLVLTLGFETDKLARDGSNAACRKSENKIELTFTMVLLMIDFCFDRMMNEKRFMVGFVFH